MKNYFFLLGDIWCLVGWVYSNHVSLKLRGREPAIYGQLIFSRDPKMVTYIGDFLSCKC